ncbi:hypothetical protein JSE7799_03379 [Jannaschia seosinensis]|uniref:Flagellar protein n=1 Tax=Jannaschia seosinensis TaxID=313367 RepID=A0A0M7BFL8_9RHOB|nr:DUF1217 domain-containing protein [Jannaschia seosinensis]CUH40644.1 hypothetical protein JSE7799_03379 [Jannaschia seosinensis]
MTYQPFVPTGGLTGWRFLQRTIESQRAAHADSAQIQRNLEYFRENIGKIETAEQLVGDFRLLSVTLDAFGLSADVGSKFFIRKVLEEGTVEDDALANRLSDKRYRDLSRAFGFGDFDTPSTKLEGFADKIAARYTDRRFEADIGQTSETMRLALNAERDLPALGAEDSSNRTKWFSLMGTAPLRKVMETALGLPKAFGTLPIDRQIETFMERSERILGTSDLSEIAAPENLSRLIDRFTVLDEAGSGSTVTSPALVLLRGF